MKVNLAPFPAAESTRMVPPWRSTTFFTTARPMPAPSTRSRGASVRKRVKIVSWYLGAIPGPAQVWEQVGVLHADAVAERVYRGFDGPALAMDAYAFGAPSTLERALARAAH